MTICWPASAPRPSCRCARPSPRRSSTKGSGSGPSTAAARGNRRLSTICWPASAPATELPLREAVARALVNKGVRLGALDRSAEEVAVYDDLLARFGTATELPLREAVAEALVNKGITLGALDRSAEEIAVYDDLLARFGTATELHRCARPSPRRSSTKGSRSRALDRSAEAIAVYDDLLARFGTATELPLRRTGRQGANFKSRFA